MQSRCRKFARDCSISITSFTVGISLVGAITFLTSQNALADSGKESTVQATSELLQLTGSAGVPPAFIPALRSSAGLSIDTALVAQASQNDGASTGDGTTSGGTGIRSTGMSDRIRKYMNNDGPPGGPPPGGPRGPDDMGGGGDKRERMRQMLQQMSPEKREQFIQEMKERRMRKRGMSDGGMDNRFMGGPDGGPPDGGPPDGGPGFGGRPPGRPGGNGISEYGFKRNNMRRDFGGGDKGGMKGKLFGREPLDLTVLNLTADQKAKIQSMRTVDGQKSRQIQAELRQRRDKFKDMLFDPAASSEQIMSTHREINKLQSQTQDIMLNDFLGIRKLLTKEQLELLPQVRPEDPRRPSPRLGAKAPPDGEPPTVDSDK